MLISPSMTSNALPQRFTYPDQRPDLARAGLQNGQRSLMLAHNAVEARHVSTQNASWTDGPLKDALVASAMPWSWVSNGHRARGRKLHGPVYDSLAPLC
jgi:hypothetical protein